MNTIKIKKSSFQKLYDLACKDWKPKLEEKLKPFIFSDYIEFTSEFFEEMRKACTSDQLKIFKIIFKDYIDKEVNLEDFNTYSKICKALKEKEHTLNDFKSFNAQDRKKQLAFCKIKQIERFFNGNWIKDWDNSNQYKWYPYFNLKASRGLVGFGGSSYGGSHSSGQVAFYKTKEISDFVGKTFWPIYKDLMD